jgi:rhomboid family GlyGly-CTERM serine protease
VNSLPAAPHPPLGNLLDAREQEETLQVRMRGLPWLTLTLGTLVVASVPFATSLDYDRTAILHGQLWRIVTGHFVHWSPAHLRWDLIAFLALGAVCERRGARVLFGVVVAATACMVSMILLLAVPDVVAYRGLSAIDSALWLWVAAVIADRRLTLALVLLFCAKLMIELSTGASLFVTSITILPSVHLAGAVIGFSAAVAERKMQHLGHQEAM